MSAREDANRNLLVAMLVPLTMLSSRLDPEKEQRTLGRIGDLLKLIEAALYEGGGSQDSAADRPLDREASRRFYEWRRRVNAGLPDLARRVFGLRSGMYPGCGFHWGLERDLGIVLGLVNDYDRTFTLASQITAEIRVEELHRRVREAEGGTAPERPAHDEEACPYRKPYEEIVTRCRTTRGPCFCGVHLTQVAE